MYDNIGRKIMLTVKVCVVVASIIYFLLGIFMMIFGIFSDAAMAVVAGILICISGPILCWISGFILYAYGQLVENTDILVEVAKDKEDCIIA